MTSQDIFEPIGYGPPAAAIGSRPDHPVPRTGINNQGAPIPTNKFYANFFLGNQNQGCWTHPYSLSWSKGSGITQSWGVSVSHIDSNQKVFGPDPNASPVQYFFSPVGVRSVILSAAELGRWVDNSFDSSAIIIQGFHLSELLETKEAKPIKKLISATITLDTLKAFSVNLNLHTQAGAPPGVTFPLVQGMGFVTAVYHSLTPRIESSNLFRSFTQVSVDPRLGLAKYKVVLEDGKTWLLYARSTSSQGSVDLKMSSNSCIQASGAFTGIIQVAKCPDVSALAESTYDSSAGSYATGASVSGYSSYASGTYSLKWTKAGMSLKPLLMFALPHHLQSFDVTTSRRKSQIQLQTTTKGLATAIVSDSWSMSELDLPVTMGFAPWVPTSKSGPNYSANAIKVIAEAAASEVLQDMNAQTNLESMYFSGKALSKFATMIYTIHDIVKDPGLANIGLVKLKDAFSVFVNNKQRYPLVYETAWKGVVSTASYVTGECCVDFGNSYYNDHHFHWGYFIHAAAIIGYLDPSWLDANRDWVNTLVRDEKAANPSEQDEYFPFSRSFDWYHGHSWAKGVFESADGKDEESSSEDALFAYAIKMWGKTSGDRSMEARGNMMLSILCRSMQNYFLLETSNRNQPSNFIANKVAGILFENKVDHTTYFGNAIQYIQGSTLARTRNFVREEWERYFDKGRVDQIDDGFKGILYANLAIIDPVSAWKFFSQSNFQSQWLDGGASRAWYLAFAAGLGGAPS
ncbi:hypothetical protein FGG08_001515 [Glutinoglossum americanum]|uniref:glucan endo-1,3-beta-D-glucosidase n=1 Tax=Glutinoglossum americanum TaxID=1670608 RepID=A0A9P8I6X3_9PEZI|nr:hypothetical protein FGG08_001515 [Glutinoglossum americanum]